MSRGLLAAWRWSLVTGFMGALRLMAVCNSARPCHPSSVRPSNFCRKFDVLNFSALMATRVASTGRSRLSRLTPMVILPTARSFSRMPGSSWTSWRKDGSCSIFAAASRNCCHPSARKFPPPDFNARLNSVTQITRFSNSPSRQLTSCKTVFSGKKGSPPKEASSSMVGKRSVSFWAREGWANKSARTACRYRIISASVVRWRRMASMKG